MFLSAKTVANNVSNILAKLHLAERGQAIVAARDAGLGRGPTGNGKADDTPGARGVQQPPETYPLGQLASSGGLTSRRRIFPVGPLGSSSTSQICRGYL